MTACESAGVSSHMRGGGGGGGMRGGRTLGAPARGRQRRSGVEERLCGLHAVVHQRFAERSEALCVDGVQAAARPKEALSDVGGVVPARGRERDDTGLGAGGRFQREGFAKERRAAMSGLSRAL